MIADHDSGDECDSATSVQRTVAWLQRSIAERLHPYIDERLTPEVRARMARSVFAVPASSVSITMKLQPTSPAWQCSSPHDPGDEDRGVLVRFAYPFGFHEVA